MCQGPGVQVVAQVPVAGPVPPPSIVVTPEASASSICCGQMKWMCASMPPAVTIMPSPAMISVPGPMTMSTPGLDVGIAGLAELRDPTILQRDVALDDAGPVDDQRVGDDGVGDLAHGSRALALPHAVADHLAAAEFHFLAVDGEVALDLDDQVGVGEPHPVADRRAEHLRVGAARDLHRALRLPVGFVPARPLRARPALAALPGADALRALATGARAAPSPRRRNRRRSDRPPARPA